MSDLKIYRRSELETIKPQIDADGCLYRYKAIWIDGVDDTSDVALIGIGFAAIKHRYITLLREAGTAQDFDLAKIAFVEGAAVAQTPSRLMPEVQKVWFFHAEKFELDLDRFVASEERGGAGDVGFAPDLVLAHPESNELEIVDDKSGWHPPLSEEALRGNFQARVYSRYGRDRWPGFTRYKFTLNAVRFNKSTSVVFSQEELDKVDLEVQAAIALIEEAARTSQWPATPGPSCHFCMLACPVAQETTIVPVRLPNRQAVAALANWLLVADKQIKAAKKLLKGAVALHGPVVVNGVEWDNRALESRSYPVHDVMEVLQLRGGMGAFEDPTLTLSYSALKKLFKQFPQLEEDLAASVKTKTTYRFGPAKPGGDDEDDE